MSSTAGQEEMASSQAQPRLQRKVLHLFETISAKLEI